MQVPTYVSRPTVSKKFIVVAIVTVFILVGLFSALRQIGTGQIGVVTRFGKVTGTELGEGLHTVAPFGVDRVTIYDIKVNKLSDEIAASTRDLQDVNTIVALNYRVDASAVSNLHKTVGPLYSSKIIEPAVNEIFKATSAQYSAAELLAKRPEVKSLAVTGLKARLGKYGIDVDDLSIVNFKFSETFTKGAYITNNQQEALAGADFVYVKNWSAFEDYGAMPGNHANWMPDNKKLAVTNILELKELALMYNL